MKPTKTSLRRKLDKKISEIVRAKGKCQRCGKKENLQACHIFSRRYLNLRWDLQNILCLCAGCHLWSHANPILFVEFVYELLGEDMYSLLKEARNQITKYTLDDLQIKLKVLEELT
jgi:hypothetical protein